MEENKKSTHESAHSHSAQTLDMPPQKSGGGKTWMIIAIIAIIALIGLGIFGYMQMKKLNQEISSQKAEIASLNNKNQELETSLKAAEEEVVAVKKTTTTTTTQTDDQQIITSVANYVKATDKNVKSVKVTVTKKEGAFAFATVEPSPADAGRGGGAILKKENGNWVVIYTGVGRPDTQEANTLGLPQGEPWR